MAPSDGLMLLGDRERRSLNAKRAVYLPAFILGGLLFATIVIIVIVVSVTGGDDDSVPPPPPPHPQQPVADQIIAKALSDDTGFVRLQYLCDRFGHRFSGSSPLEAAIDWMHTELQADGFDNVMKEEVMVPRWVRGEESLVLTAPYSRPLNAILGLGGTVSTPPEGISAEVLVVRSFEELAERAEDAVGRIVVYDVPFTTYGETVPYRRNGASFAAQYGAVAALVRSVTPYSLQTPHTGNMYYNDSFPQIPTAAITVEDSELLHRIQARGEGVPAVTLVVGGVYDNETMSYNVMGEIVGSTYPDEVVVIGGHIDSWDVGQGAHDDAGGVLATWEALRVLKELGLTAKRTIRMVAWTNEENGVAGGRTYFENRKDEMDKVSLAIEMDSGVFQPLGYGFTGSPAALSIMTDLGRLLDVRSAGVITEGGGGVDIQPMMDVGVPGAGLEVGGVYFNYHHTIADTVDKIDMGDFMECTASIAVMAYSVADLDEMLPRDTN